MPVVPCNSVLWHDPLCWFHCLFPYSHCFLAFSEGVVFLIRCRWCLVFVCRVILRISARTAVNNCVLAEFAVWYRSRTSVATFSAFSASCLVSCLVFSTLLPPSLGRLRALWHHFKTFFARSFKGKQCGFFANLGDVTAAGVSQCTAYVVCWVGAYGRQLSLILHFCGWYSGPNIICYRNFLTLT